jgi:hypothetical protein
VIEQPRAQLQGDHAHGVALTFQHAAVADQRKQVIAERERSVVAGGYEPQVHERLYHGSEIRVCQSRGAIICRRFQALSGPAAVMHGAAGAWKKIAAGREAAAAYALAGGRSGYSTIR